MDIQINTAAGTLAVFWALIMLKHNDKRHSVSNIIDVLRLPDTASPITISSHLQRLEEWGAITRIEQPGKGYGNGQSVFYSLHPFRIPRYVWTTPASKATKSRYIHKLLELELIYEGEPGVYYLNGETILEHGERQLVGVITVTFSLVGRLRGMKGYEIERLVIEYTRHEKLLADLNRFKFAFDPYFLRWFHFYVVTLCVFKYAEAALS